MENSAFERNDYKAESGTFFESLLKNARETCIMVLSADGTIMDCNSGLIHTFGYSREELAGKNFSMLFIEEDRKKNLPQLTLDAVLTKGAASHNKYLVHKNGNPLWVHAECILAGHHDKPYIVKLLFDIDKQKKLEEYLSGANNQLLESRNFTNKINADLVSAHEELLKVSEDFRRLFLEKEQQARFYQTILSNTADFIYSFDLEGRFTYVNKGLLDLWQLRLEDVLGKTFKELNYPREIAEKHLTQIATVIATGKPLRDSNFYTSQLGKRYYEYIFVPLNEGDKVLGVAGTTRDITHRYNLEKELKEKNDELKKINIDLDTFVYTASHDLKAPIANIQGLLLALKETMSEESRKNSGDLFSLVDSSIDKFQQVLNDLARTAREKVNDVSEVSFLELIEETKLNLHQLIQKYKPVIMEDLSLAPSIRFSRKNIRSILHNLISNAIKYSSPDRRPQIAISTEKAGGYTVLKISDNGLGIKEEEKAKVFRMYERLQQDAAVQVEGTGVGLGIVARIVDSSGGKIEIDSEVGKGSTFKIYLKSREQ